MNATTGGAPANLSPLRKFNKFVTVIFLSLLLGLAAGEPVLASSQSVGSIDYDTIGTTAMTADLYAGQSAYYIGDDMSELRVPVRLKFVNGGDIGPYAWAYLSGITRYNVGTNIFGVDTNSPINVNPAYFEGIHTDNLNVIWDVNGLRIYFDNYRIDSSQGQYREIFLGYMVYQFDPPSTGFQYTFPTPNRSSLSPANNNMRGSAYEYGFVEAVIYALDQSESLADIYSTLLMIAQDTDYLRAILDGLETLDSHALYLLQTADEIRDLLDGYINPTTNPAAEVASGAAQVAESAVNAEAAAVASLAALSPGNMSDLDDADPMAVLDDISNSTVFWGQLVQGFSEYSSALWGVFIFALLVGLVSFILRLR